MSEKTKSNSGLAYLLYFCILMNGFEAGGYQVSLASIATQFHLSQSAMGGLASIQLVAVLVAPLLFGPLADKWGKRRVLVIFMGLRIAACLLISIISAVTGLMIGIFLIGISVSIVQYVALAALSDAYPQSGKKKMGLITGMYSAGALSAPWLCGQLLDAGYSWKWLFIILGLSALISINYLWRSDFASKEIREEAAIFTKGKFYGGGITLLCLIMFLYCGAENGIAFFMNSFAKNELQLAHAYWGLSLFWGAMIPSRLLAGGLYRYRKIILVISCAAAGICLFGISIINSGWLFLSLSFILGFVCGMIYPCVLNYMVDFAGSKSATASGLISIACGLGGAIFATGFGLIADWAGIRAAYVFLGIAMLVALGCTMILIAYERKWEVRNNNGKVSVKATE